MAWLLHDPYYSFTEVSAFISGGVPYEKAYRFSTDWEEDEAHLSFVSKSCGTGRFGPRCSLIYARSLEARKRFLALTSNLFRYNFRNLRPCHALKENFHLRLSVTTL